MLNKNHIWGVKKKKEKAGKVFRNFRKPFRCCIPHKYRVKKLETYLWESCLAEMNLPTIYYFKSESLTLGGHRFQYLLHQDGYTLVHVENWPTKATVASAYHLRSWAHTHSVCFLCYSKCVVFHRPWELIRQWEGKEESKEIYHF